MDRRIRVKQLLVINVLTFVLVASTFSQNINLEFWPDPDSCEVFHVSPPERIPIINPDMPDEVRRFYTFLDSTCRLYTLFESRERLPMIADDSIQMLWKWYNESQMYDPFLFEFQWHYLRTHKPQEYKSDWSGYIWELVTEYYRRYLGIANYQGVDIDKPEDLIRRADGIYRVRGLSFFERHDTGFAVEWPGPCSKITQCADVEVVEVYKGRRFYSSCNPLQHELPEGAGCLRIKWDVFTCDSSQWRRSRMMPGHDYLVFTGYFRSPGFNSKGPFRWVVAPVKRFELVNGLLLDPERYFKKEATIPFDEIELLIRNRMNELTGM